MDKRIYEAQEYYNTLNDAERSRLSQIEREVETQMKIEGKRHQDEITISMFVFFGTCVASLVFSIIYGVDTKDPSIAYPAMGLVGLLTTCSYFYIRKKNDNLFAEREYRAMMLHKATIKER